jgi:hypothetical protein
MAQSAHKFRAGLLQFPHMKLGQRRQNPFALRSNAQQHLAMVSWIAASPQKTLFDGAIHQLNSAVVLEQHAGGYIGDCWLYPVRHATDALQHLILLIAQARLFCSTLADVQKTAKLKAKLCESLHLCHVEFRRRRSSSIA